MKKLIGCLLLGIITDLLGSTQVWAQKNEELAREMRDAVTTFLKVLNPEQRQETELPYADLARFDWNFTPRARKGITFKTLTPAQRKVAMAMVRVVLSQEGYSKAEQIIDLENVLRVVESRPANDTYRDPENYAFLVFGTPGNDPWGWRMEGHHLSLHFSSIDNQVTFTPSFFASASIWFEHSLRLCTSRALMAITPSAIFTPSARE